ncbi:MAG: NUDIX hydrolase [Clostridia bacterium]|nr:NUDIX hydrolase [Clostridia bacterium]
MELYEKTLEQTPILNGRVLTVHVDKVELPNGRTSTREVVDHPGGVCVAPLTDEGDLLFVRQFRYPYGEVVLELPAGKREPGEDPLITGKRELLEETGATADEMIDLGSCYPSPGYTSEVIYLYGATGLHIGENRPDEDEFLEPERIPLEVAAEMVMNGTITDAKTQILILKLWKLRQEGTI